MSRIITLASTGILAVGLVATGLVGATAAQAAGIPPVGTDDYYTVAQGGTLTVPAPGVLANDTDAENDGLHVGNAFNYQGADSVTVNGDGSFSFTPVASFYGQASFSYYPADDATLGAETTVHITVEPTVVVPPTPLVANADSYSTPQDTVLTVPAATGLFANDNGPAYLQAVNAPGGGVNVDANTGAFVYTPPAGFVGQAVFGYRITNGTTISNDALVTITVTATVPPPGPVVKLVGAADSYSTLQDTPLNAVGADNLAANDPDSGDVVNVSDLTGEVTVDAAGNLQYVPASGFVGTKTFTYQLDDHVHAVSDPILVTIEVTAPVIIPTDPIVHEAGDGSTPVPAPSPETTLNESTLAYTGATNTWLAAPALLLVVLGAAGVLFGAMRRRRVPH